MDGTQLEASFRIKQEVFRAQETLSFSSRLHTLIGMHEDHTAHMQHNSIPLCHVEQ